MVNVLKSPRDYSTGLYDEAISAFCVTEKVVDATDDCPAANVFERVLLLFTRVDSGRIVQIMRPYAGEKYMGVGINFLVEELGNKMNIASPDDTFGKWAGELGLTKEELRELIEEHAPA